MAHARHRQAGGDGHQADDIQRSAPGKRTLTEGIQRKAAAAGDGPAILPTAGRETAPGAGMSSDLTFLDSLLTAPVQRRADEGAAAAPDVHALAAAGTAGLGARLPFLDEIQASFGAHDVSAVQAHSDGSAAAAARGMGASAFATGNHVAFTGAPDLHTTAHEAAHVVQQRAGVHLKGGVGEDGDAYERHADAVADAVVRGESAEALLGSAPVGAVAASADPIQRKGESDDGTSHSAQNKKDLAAAAAEAIDVATVDCHHLIEHKNETASAALGSSIHSIHGLIAQLEPAARKPLRGKVEQLSSAIAMVINAKVLARSRVDSAMPVIRELVGLPPAFVGAAATARDVDEGDHHDDVANAVLHAIDLAGSSAKNANEQLAKAGTKDDANAHAGLVAAVLYRILSQAERMKKDMPEVLPGLLKVGSPKVKAAMAHVRALERRGKDGGWGFRDLLPRAFEVRELFGAVDADDQEKIDDRKISDADRRRGDDGIEEKLGDNADKIEKMRDKKQATEAMLQLVASESEGMFNEAAAGVRDLAGAALEKDAEKSKSGWAIFVDLAVNCVTAGLGGALAFKLVGAAADGIRKAMVEEIMPTLLSETVNGMRQRMDSVGAGDRNARGFFSKQDAEFTNKATSAEQSVIAQSAKYLDKDVDYVQALIELRGLLGELSRKRTEMARVQKAVSLSEYSKGLASEDLGKDNQKLEKSATIEKRFETRGRGRKQRFTGDTDDVDVDGVMDIKFARGSDIFYPEHIKISGLNDALRGKLTTFEVGDTSMPKVIYGELGGGRLAFGVIDGKVTNVDADANSIIALHALAMEGKRTGDPKLTGADEIWKRIARWDLRKLED